ncbi:MAG: hypothetical protein L7U52_00650, partial [Alphaproteobacteria bacterium]|nr:hypothetical protein [Alphaproteobacteria bacterium]
MGAALAMRLLDPGLM